jgi:transcription-repair coupling factor (superfamily II helicase)
MYKRISSAANEQELDSLRQEMIDRFGQYPEQVENLFKYAQLRQKTLELQIQSIEKSKERIFFRFVDHSKVSAEKLLKLVTKNKNAAFSPQGLLTLDLPAVSPPQLFEAIDKVLESIKM